LESPETTGFKLLLHERNPFCGHPALFPLFKNAFTRKPAVGRPQLAVVFSDCQLQTAHCQLLATQPPELLNMNTAKSSQSFSNLLKTLAL